MYDSSSLVLYRQPPKTHILWTMSDQPLLTETKPAVLIWSVLTRSLVDPWEYHTKDGIICILSGVFPVESVCNTAEADFGATSVR